MGQETEVTESQSYSVPKWVAKGLASALLITVPVVWSFSERMTTIEVKLDALLTQSIRDIEHISGRVNNNSDSIQDHESRIRKLETKQP